ncbi:MAG: hypothetical protein IJW46_03015 [Clostridia bacterium]|nr:hypothetical protein [Clostridia bacterium]
MIRYEYLTLQSYSPCIGGSFTVYTAYGATELTARNLSDAMTQLGKEGWELVSATQSEPDGTLCCFKRALT